MTDPSHLKQKIREEIWGRLEREGVATFPKPVRGKIPNFRGSEEAARILCNHRFYRTADVVFVNPDSPQLAVREAVLRDGKQLVMASPRLRRGFLRVRARGDIRFASTIRGAMRMGEKVDPAEIRVDLMVEGSVAVDRRGGRMGKGGGFGDLEYAILAQVNAVSNETPIATTVHELQIVDRIPMLPHDVPVDLIVTPRNFLETPKLYDKPPGIFWERVSEKMLQEIPLLREMRKKKE